MKKWVLVYSVVAALTAVGMYFVGYRGGKIDGRADGFVEGVQYGVWRSQDAVHARLFERPGADSIWSEYVAFVERLDSISRGELMR